MPENIDFRKMKLYEFADLIRDNGLVYILSQAQRSNIQYKSYRKLYNAFAIANRRQIVLELYENERNKGCTLEQALENISESMRHKVSHLRNILFRKNR